VWVSSWCRGLRPLVVVMSPRSAAGVRSAGDESSGGGLPWLRFRPARQRVLFVCERSLSTPMGHGPVEPLDFKHSMKSARPPLSPTGAPLLDSLCCVLSRLQGWFRISKG